MRLFYLLQVYSSRAPITYISLTLLLWISSRPFVYLNFINKTLSMWYQYLWVCQFWGMDILFWHIAVFHFVNAAAIYTHAIEKVHQSAISNHICGDFTTIRNTFVGKKTWCLCNWFFAKFAIAIIPLNDLFYRSFSIII